MRFKQSRVGIWVALAVMAALSLGAVARAESYSGELSAPPGMEVEWASVPSSAGAVVKAWVKEDLILLETDKHSLVAVRRSDGFHLWQCDLEKSPRFAPSVSRANVLVNVDNYLIAIDKRGGNVRWKLAPDFIMSTEPLLVDPAIYPPQYTNQWQNLETIYVPGWDSRMHAYWSRGKLSILIKGIRPGEDVIAPAFDLFKKWQKANRNGAFTLFPARLRDGVLYYTADNNYISAVNHDGEEQEPYYMQGAPCTEVTVTTSSLFVGARDSFVYCLDRLLMKKKWTYAPGMLARGTIFADEPQTPLVYIPLEDGTIQSVRVITARVMHKGEFETPEHIADSWKTKGEGTITAGPRFVYFGIGKVGDRAYKSVSAVDKENGNTLWTESSAAQYLEYHNNWSNRNSGARIYAVNADGQVVSYKEKRRETGIIVAKMPVEPEVDTSKMPEAPKKIESGGDKPDDKKPDEKKPDDAKPDAKPDDKKPDEKKPDEKKPDEKKPDDAKPDEKKPADK